MNETYKDALNDTVCAVVVTYNRKNLLLECLEALLKQTRPVDAIYIIDNFSSDGTPETLRENGYIAELPPDGLNEPWEKEFEVKNLTDGRPVKVYYVRMNENTGGAGGFYEGVKRGYERGYDWLWLMDDDAIPAFNALEVLLIYLGYTNGAGVLCSNVIWLDGSTHIMNIPQVSALIPFKEGAVAFNHLIQYGLIRIMACSFVSVLISHYAISMVGLPIKEMFIYGDDIEYTNRISRQFPCYYVPSSNILHKTNSNTGVDIKTVSSEKIWAYFFQIRNTFYLCRQKGIINVTKYSFVEWPYILFKALRRKSDRLYAVKVLIKGFIAGFFFNPKIKFINEEID